MGILYRATLVADGRKYYGITKRTLEERREGHLKDAMAGKGFYFQSALKKHGAEAFIWEVVEQHDDLDLLCEREKHWIAKEGTTDPSKGFNLAGGGQMFRPSEETSKKLSEQKQGEKNPMYGKPITDEHRENLRAAHGGEGNGMFGKKQSEEAKAKIAAKITGSHHTEETKAKMSAAKLGKPISEKAHLARMGRPAPNKGVPMSDEAKQKISETAQRKREAKKREQEEGK